jgi:hypothetical protein
MAAKKQTKSSGNAALFAFKTSLQVYPRSVAHGHTWTQTVGLCAVKHILSSTNIVKLDYDI